MATEDELRRALSERVLLHRRRFLGLMAAGAGAVALGACTSGGSDGEPATTTSGAPGSTTPSGEGPTVADGPVPAADGIDTDPFLLGVASGDPLPGSVVLWTRLATDLFAADGLGGLGDTDHAVRWEVASDEGFTDIVASGDEPAPADLGHTVHAEPEGLDPDTWYWYRFRIGDHTSPVGRTRTTPADGTTPDELTFAFASCQSRGRGYWSSYDHVVTDEPDLVLFLGDYVYEGGSGADDTSDLGVPIDGEAVDLPSYRALYAAYKRDPQLQAAHAVAPWVVTWDDHEVENNYASEIPQDEPDTATFPDRRAAAYQAFWENHPVRIDRPADDGSLQVYRTVRFGDLAEFFVLDGRQYRTDQVCGDTVPTDATECDELGDESHTMLGTEQEEWLVDGLRSSEATWKVLAQQTVMKALVLGDLVLNVDQWDGYPAARGRLLEQIQADEIDNVMVLTGDIHAGGAADIRTPDAGVTGDIVAHELVAPGVSSQGIAELGSAIDLSSLGLAYANFTDNGYVRCTVTPEAWTTDFVVVDTIDQRESPARVAATVEVTAGTPGLQKV